MQSLESFADIMVPNKQVPCIDNELVNPRQVQRLSAHFQKSYSHPINNDLRLTDAYFSAKPTDGYIGYKTMPYRHGSLAQLGKTFGIQFITLYRRDIAATVASFMVAKQYNEWRRSGGEQTRQIVFDANLHDRVLYHLNYVVKNQARMLKVPGAIEVFYEDMCTEDFEHRALNDYFARRIRLLDPKPPIKVSQYVANWQAYTNFVNLNYKRMFEQLRGRAPRFAGV